MIPGLPPGILLLLGSLLIPLIPAKVPRQVYLLLLPLLSFFQMLYLEPGVQLTLAGFELELYRADGLAMIFGYVFHLALLVGLVYALHVDDVVQQFSAMVYGGGTIAAVFAGDLASLFIFWEVVAVASTFLIWARGTPRAIRAGMRYLAWQIGSGLLLLAGMLALRVEGTAEGLTLAETLAFDDRLTIETTGGLLIFLAFGVKSAWPFLHTWLSDGYPEATPTGAVFLSAFTSKLAVYALARSFAGTEELVWIGAAMAGFPIFFAVIENDMRRVLAYSLINQVGFMVVGVGIGSAMGVNGACAHAFADVIFKGLLFMTMGAVMQQTGRINANELGGLYKAMPFTAVCCLVGAASISAFPLFSAFATKSMIMEAVGEEHFTLVWFVLLFAAAGVFHHAGIKIPYFAFFGPHDARLRPPPPPWNMRAAMGFAAFMCIAIGCYPAGLYELLPVPMDHPYQPYTVPHVVTQLQLLFYSALAFAVLNMIGRYPPELHSVNLDTDWLLRKPGQLAYGFLTGPLAQAGSDLTTWVLDTLPGQAAAAVTRRGSAGAEEARVWAVGYSVLVMVVLLFVYLLFGGSVDG